MSSSMPALLKAQSRRPKACTASRTRRSTSLGSDTSARTKRASPPAAWASSSVRSPSLALRPDTTTRAPARAKATAVARPLPVVPPVTGATLFFSGSSFCMGILGGGKGKRTSVHVADDLVEREADLGESGVGVLGRAASGGGGAHGSEAARGELEERVVTLRLDALHRAGVDAEHRRAGQEGAEREVHLSPRPLVHVEGLRLGHVRGHHLLVGGQRLAWLAAHGGDALDVPLDVRPVQALPEREHDEVRALGDLRLVLRGLPQPRAY